MTTPIDAWPTWRSRVVGASQGGYRPLLVGHPAGQLGGSKRARGWWRRRTPIKMERRKWPWRRTAARPIAAAADETTRRRPPQDVCRRRCQRTWWSGVCGPRDALGRSPLLEQNFACAFAKNRDEKSMTAAADSAVHDHHGIDRRRHWTSTRKTSRTRGPCPHIDDRSCISRALPPPRGRSRMVIFWRAWSLGSASFEPKQGATERFRWLPRAD